MSVGSVAVQLKYGLYVGHLSKLAFQFMFKVVRWVVVVSSVRLACNGLRLVAERDLEARCFNLALLPIRTTNDECSTSALFATNRCYVLGGLSALNLI